MNDNVIYVIYHSPNVNILSKGRILKENKTKIYIEYNNKLYVYVKDKQDVGKCLSYREGNVFLFRKNGDNA